MKSHAKSDSPVRTAPGPKSAVPNSYAPAVPISVYRELAEELQATKSMLESVNGQNQQLAKQNQQLRQEIEKVVQSALQLRQMADANQFAGTTWNAPPVAPPKPTQNAVSRGIPNVVAVLRETFSP
ncbi:MAG: hypothetical protein F6K19_49375 [Cyanothece sp. SIO1E1]|nr:hypothetical protein [Cyanothece sp. SIO1E1]